MSQPLEREFMLRALELAARARGHTSPNPMVGALVVKDGQVLGQGWHRQAGTAHAEVIALRRAGHSARGATLILNLEPCSHYGRTPPCADAVIRAGIARVVVAMRDPDPRVRGRGINRLRRAGIEVEVGLLREAAERLNEVFIHRALTGGPFVALKLAQSLDGAIAAAPGLRTGISSAASLRLAHSIRSGYDSILVGISTVLADDPLLTVRGVRGAHQPLRVVLDSRLRLPLASRLAAGAKDFPTLVLFDPDRAGPGRAEALQALGIDTSPMAQSTEGGLDPGAVLEALGARGVTSLLVEGGRAVAGSFLRARRVERLHLFIAPRLYGEGGPLHGFPDIGLGSANGPLSLIHPERQWLGPDIYLTGRLQYPAG